MRPATASRAQLTVLAAARWRTADDGPPPPVAGFVLSEFSPLVAAAAERCLASHFGAPPVAAGDRIGVLLVSPQGDIATARAVGDVLDQGRRVPPLLFFQSNPNAVLGHVTSRWGLGGPVVSLGAGHGEPVADENPGHESGRARGGGSFGPPSASPHAPGHDTSPSPDASGPPDPPPGGSGPLGAAALLLDDGDADLVLLLTARPGLATAALCAAPPATAVEGAAEGSAGQSP